MPIVTPISHLSTEKNFFKKILKFGALEVRDNSNFKGYESFVKMYHSELELTQKWSEIEKSNLIDFISNFPNLKGLSFHMVTRHIRYKILEGVAIGLGKPLSEITLLENTNLNVIWLKNKFPDMILMVENNNDLGSTAYKIVTDPDFINEVVSNNNINFLYDHSHAMISAYNQKIPFNKYFFKLPIARVKQVHLSEPTFKNNIAKDSHLAPSKDQIDFCVKNFGNKIDGYTIEFYKSIDELESNLSILRNAL